MSKDPKDERAHRARIEAYAIQVRLLYNSALKEFAQLIEGLDIDPEKPFSFADYPNTKARLGKLLQGYAERLTVFINRNTTAEWYAAMRKRDTRMPVKNIYTARNREALQAFQERTENGFNLSKRVWKYTQQFQQEIELAMSSGLVEGTSANELARSLQKHLNEPDKLFRRVRDKHGVLQLSKNARAYRPGRGVYRSSFKNALRLTRNETNDAYRSADHFRWQQDASVIGFEVKLSNRHVVRDICDDLKGKYPKTFKFRGWHTNCLCYAVPILMNDDDFDLYQQSILNDEAFTKKPSGTVEQVPKGFSDWVENNRERVNKMSNKPYFWTDNVKE